MQQEEKLGATMDNEFAQSNRSSKPHQRRNKREQEQGQGQGQEQEQGQREDRFKGKHTSMQHANEVEIEIEHERNKSSSKPAFRSRKQTGLLTPDDQAHEPRQMSNGSNMTSISFPPSNYFGDTPVPTRDMESPNRDKGKSPVNVLSSNRRKSQEHEETPKKDSGKETMNGMDSIKSNERTKEEAKDAKKRSAHTKVNTWEQELFHAQVVMKSEEEPSARFIIEQDNDEDKVDNNSTYKRSTELSMVRIPSNHSTDTNTSDLTLQSSTMDKHDHRDATFSNHYQTNPDNNENKTSSNDTAQEVIREVLPAHLTEQDLKGFFGSCSPNSIRCTVDKKNSKLQIVELTFDAHKKKIALQLLEFMKTQSERVPLVALCRDMSPLLKRLWNLFDFLDLTYRKMPSHWIDRDL
ncbi:HMG box family protein [Reticulomyxa filosa]|uniref:HMG box family protein n=1 Tax=Reticulomyxa filosa TaxID=46433 RepID=X6MX28_RETFI|nr:HMG box family protein [Reticulomyxa filosa]|eukprot:ETO18196.1 HMG box family protein [Reticulomyxa filosa]